MSEYVLGVDGGQSGTTAVIGDAHGKIVGWASAGPCNHVAAAGAKAKFLRVMRECLSQAASRAGIALPAFKSVCFGMSGGPADKAALLHQVIDSEHWIVTDDAMVALAGATSGEPGIVVIGGTGSIAFAQNSRGETARAGGWGYLFGDEGGAFDIVRQSLRAILREHEGWGARTALTPALLGAASASDAAVLDANALLHLFYTADWPRQRIAGLAEIVNRIAEDGDPLAIGVLHNAARELALLAASVRRQLWDEGESARIAWVGGVFRSAMLLERFRALVGLEENTICEPPRHGPAVGALLLAYRAAGIRDLRSLIQENFIPGGSA
jgi:N-acetylglucosamine kinase-like BadF-type ATPase